MSDGINQDNFEKLLIWLDPDREKAAEIYEQIRTALIAVFKARGFRDAENLADMTFDRVAAKIDELETEFEGEKIKLFLSFSRYVGIETLRRKVRFTDTIKDFLQYTDYRIEHEILGKHTNWRKICLQECLQHLREREKNMVLDFYNHSARTGLPRHHQTIADKYFISINALRVKVHRIRKSLHKCVKKCVDAKKK